MPASWAELIRATAALLQRFSVDPSAVDNEEDLFAETEQWHNLAQACCKSEQQQQRIPAGESEELQRLLRRLAGAVVAWDAHLQQLLQGPAALIPRKPTRVAKPVLLFGAAGAAAMGSLDLARSLEPSAEAALDIFRPVALALGSGRLLASHMVEARHLYAATFPGSEAEPFKFSLSSMLALQVLILLSSLGLAFQAGTLSMLAQRFVPAHALVAWLDALVAALQTTPLPTASEQQPQQPPQQQQKQQPQQLQQLQQQGQSAQPAMVHALASTALQLAKGVADMCGRQLQASQILRTLVPESSPAEVEPCPELFEAACRLIHWAASQPEALHRLLPAEQPLLQLLPLLNTLFDPNWLT
ncbi:hypothetical protein ABPG75_003371 [Micractinium tetrahymenae]